MASDFVPVQESYTQPLLAVRCSARCVTLLKENGMQWNVSLGEQPGDLSVQTPLVSLPRQVFIQARHATMNELKVESAERGQHGKVLNYMMDGEPMLLELALALLREDYLG